MAIKLQTGRPGEGMSKFSAEAKARRQPAFVFVHPSRIGPRLKRFTDPHLFQGYVIGWKQVAGADSVTFLDPYIVQAHA